MIDVLTQYHLKFFNKVVGGTNDKLCSAPDNTMYNYIAGHLQMASSEIEFESILEDINTAISNNLYDLYTSAGESSIEITPIQVTIENIYSLPTNDYKEIITKWIEFCKTPPLMHQRV